MSGPQKTTIVTGASQGIGAGIVKAFFETRARQVAEVGCPTIGVDIDGGSAAFIFRRINLVSLAGGEGEHDFCLFG